MNALNSARRHPLVVAIVSAALLGAATTASAVTRDAIDPGMLAALERDLGMTTAQYLRELEVEREAADLVAQAEREFGDDFAGAWLERDEFGDARLVVATRDNPSLMRVAGSEVREVRYSVGDLEDAVSLLDETNQRRMLRPLRGLQSWGIDLPNNRVVVTVSPDAARDVVDFVAATGVDTGTLHFEVSEHEPSTLINIYGGIRYNGCSIGFPVTRGSTKGFVTAGHCGSVGSQVRINNVLVGSFQRSNFPGADAAWATVRSQDTLFNRVWQYSGSSTYAVTGSREALIGAAVCRSGFRTGWRCGTLTRNNVTVNYGQGAVNGLRESNACAGQGDSGGSWVASSNQAQGVTSGGALGNDGTNCGIPQNQRRTWFQRLVPMLNSYGVNLVTR